MARNLPGDQGQTYLMPRSLEGWLPESHLARFVLDAVAPIELAAQRVQSDERWLADGVWRRYYDFTFLRAEARLGSVW